MDKFDTHREQLFNLIFNSSKDSSYKPSEEEKTNFTNDYLDNRIKDCRDEKIRHPESLSFFDLEEGEAYYLLSGLNHPSFKVVEKLPSQYEGLPYYQVKYIDYYYFTASKIIIPEAEKEVVRGFSNSMIFSRYMHIPRDKYSN